MRLGCGCLIGVMLVVAGLAGLGWAAYNALADPGVAPVNPSAADAQRAQQKIYAIVSRSAGAGRSTILSEAELNAFLSRNLVDAAELPLADINVDLSEPPRARIAGKTRLGALLTEPPLRALRGVVPLAWLERPIWLQLAASPSVEVGHGRRRYLRLHVHELRLGRQRLPALLVRLMLDPGTLRLLRWPVPETVEDVTVEKGRVVVRIAS